MNSSELDQALAGLNLGPVRYFERIGSTNDECRRWLAAQAPDLALVVADEQTSGRGREGRKWYSPAGAGLAFSLALRPGGSPLHLLSHLTALGALAVVTAIRDSYGLSPAIKWPNDVLLNARKVAGILVETHWAGDEMAGAVLGIGINITPQAVASVQAGEPALRFPATCIEEALGRAVDRWVLLRAVLQALLAWRQRLGQQEFLQAWEDNLALRGGVVRLALAGSPVVQEGLIVGLNPDGALRLRISDGSVLTAHAGELSLPPNPAE